MSWSWFQTGWPARSSIFGVVRNCSRKLKPSRLPETTLRYDAPRAAGEGNARLRAPGASRRGKAVSDDPVILIVGMGHALVPGDKAVRPAHAVNVALRVRAMPARKPICPGQQDVLARSRHEPNGFVRRAASLNEPAFTVHPPRITTTSPGRTLCAAPERVFQGRSGVPGPSSIACGCCCATS